jgi:hypothetical protein
MSVSIINFFQPCIWEKGALLKEIDRNLAAADDPYGSGRWQSALAPQFIEKYKATLGGRPIESFDPNGYLAELGLAQSMAAGRSNVEMLRAFQLVGEYRPDPRYFPLPKKIGAFVQKIFLSINRISPPLANAADRLVGPLAVKKIEKKFSSDRRRWTPYGRIEEIAKGDHCGLLKEARYFGILRRDTAQYAWDRGPHTGSIDPGHRITENFGTYEIALKFGFTEQQAGRIATKCYDVDTSNTHYLDPHDRTRPRITGTVGKIGDLHRHYNRSPAGREDTRITAAKIHLKRALKLANMGYYDAAEQELGIGLHSLQDIFSHCQLTPMTHTCLGEFPDIVTYHPLAMFETAIATEGYFKKFISGLNLKPLDPAAESQIRKSFTNSFIAGNASLDEKAALSQKIAGFPQGLSAFLLQSGVRIFVGAPDTRLTELGFGLDLDGDGRITPGRWVDINKDGRQQWFEVEDQFSGGRQWDQQPAAYNHRSRMIFISAGVLKDPGFEKILKHEINHAIDLTCGDHPQLKDKWNAYLEKLYNDARRQGKIAFDALDPHEYFALVETS